MSHEEEKADYATRAELLQAVETVLEQEVPETAEQHPVVCLRCLETGARNSGFDVPPTKMHWTEAVQKVRYMLFRNPNCNAQVTLHAGDKTWIFRRSSFHTGRGSITARSAQPHDD
jgi:hypothetical protein